jgi:hypothetical protein
LFSRCPSQSHAYLPASLALSNKEESDLMIALI